MIIKFHKSFYIIFLISVTLRIYSQNNNSNDIEGKPILIVTTDIGGDPDDTQSMIRLLLYSNEFEIRGLIASASGTRGELGIDTVQPQLILELLDAYAEVWPMLFRHDQYYPKPDYLRQQVKAGNKNRGIDYIGNGNDTQASNWIIEQVDNAESIVNIAIWGGQTDVVQALWQVQHSRTFEDYFKFVSTVRIYDINDQDGLYDYVKSQFPELLYILAKAPEGVDKREGAYRGMYLGGDELLTSREWINDNIRQGHGPLGSLYPNKTWTAPNPYDAMKEGDTPSWFFFLVNGLQEANHPEWGGWGGRFEMLDNGYYRDGEDFAGSDIHARATVYRWRPAYQADFANRMDRCVFPPGKVNNPPEVVLNGISNKDIMTALASEGEKLTFNTIGTYDPDGDSLIFKWWIYPEAGSAQQCPEMWPIDQPDVALELPVGEGGREMHLILEVKDNGKPALTSYRRIIINIQDE